MSKETRGNYTDEEWKELADAWKQEAPELFDAAKKVREVFKVRRLPTLVRYGEGASLLSNLTPPART